MSALLRDVCPWSRRWKINGSAFQPHEANYRPLEKPSLHVETPTVPAVRPSLADPPPKCAVHKKDWQCAAYMRRIASPQRVKIAASTIPSSRADQPQSPMPVAPSDPNRAKCAPPHPSAHHYSHPTTVAHATRKFAAVLSLRRCDQGSS